MTVLAHNYMPAVRYGAKWLPQEILGGGLGLPYVGNIYWVDPSGGSDSNAGDAPDNAMATVAAAFELATSGNHDVIIINPTGGTGRTSETTAIDWNKRFTHLIGNAAPTMQDARAGMSFTGTSGTAAGSLTISENGCIFANLTFNGTDDVNVPVTISGDYNSFSGCDFKGSLNGTSGDDAAARALVISGGQENTFTACTFGADTYNRSTTNATLEFASAASRNVFESCNFIMAADNVGPVHVLFTGTSAIDRWIQFNNCTWYSFWANDADKITAVMDLSDQTATGHVLLTGSQVAVGADDWEASTSGRIYMQSFTATDTAIGLAINPAVS